MAESGEVKPHKDKPPMKIKYTTLEHGELVTRQTEQGGSPALKVEHTTMIGGKTVKVTQEGSSKVTEGLPDVPVDPLGLRPDKRQLRR